MEKASEGTLGLGGEGNTVLPPPIKKQANRKKYYCFTVFNVVDIQVVKDRMLEIGIKGIIGNEICPKTKTKHLQCFIALKKAMRITELKLPYNPHCQACNGNEEQNVKYCSKESDVWKFGFPKPIKIIQNLYPWQKKVENLIMTEPDDRTITWIFEGNGNVGKTQLVKYLVVKHKTLFCNGGKHTDIMNLVFNQDMDNTTAIVFDIPRANKGNISYASLEAIKNGMVCNTKYETGVKIFNPPHVIVFANFPPESEGQLSMDRWNMFELIEGDLVHYSSPEPADIDAIIPGHHLYDDFECDDT